MYLLNSVMFHIYVRLGLLFDTGVCAESLLLCRVGVAGTVDVELLVATADDAATATFGVLVEARVFLLGDGDSSGLIS